MSAPQAKKKLRAATANPSSAAAHAQETRSREGREAEGEQSGTSEQDETQGQWCDGCTWCANGIDWARSAWCG